MAKQAKRAYGTEYLKAIRSLDGDIASRKAADAYLATTGVPLVWAANPVILDDKRLAVYTEAAATMGSIMEKVMAKYQRDRNFRALFGLEPEIEELTMVPSGRHAAVPLSRIDLFCGDKPEDFTICAIVTGGIDGMASSVEATRAITQTSAYHAFADKHEGVETFDPVNECILSILHTYGTWANAEEGRNHPTNPSLAVVDVAGSPRAAETAYVVDRLRELGCYAYATTFDRLRIERVGGVRQLVGDQGPITCAWLRATAGEAADLASSGVKALVEATKRGLVCTVGGYRSWPCCTRSFLTVLRTDECRELLTDEENAFVEAHVPETHILDASVDLSDFYDQDEWVLKIEDGHEAEHVLAGVGLRKQDWRKYLVKGIRRHDAVQVYIKQYSMDVIPGPVAEGADPVETKRRNMMLGLYAFEGRLGGVRATCGEGNTINDWTETMEMGCLAVRR